jgi:hypothetical protein
MTRLGTVDERLFRKSKTIGILDTQMDEISDGEYRAEKRVSWKSALASARSRPHTREATSNVQNYWQRIDP